MGFNICTLGSCASIFLLRFLTSFGGHDLVRRAQGFHSSGYHSSAAGPNGKLSTTYAIPFLPA